MKAAFILAVLMATPANASDYVVKIISESMEEQQSVFREIEFPQPTFVEKMQPSSGGFSTEASSFGLKNMNNEARVRTETALSELRAKPQGGSIIVDLPSDILFDFDKADIRLDARPILLKLAGVLNAMSERRVSIIGHTDSKGSDEYNDRLSNCRAISVKNWLSESGVTSEMTTEGKGERSPVAPNITEGGIDDPKGRQLNRRVEFIIGGE
ncbi:OmpA family protein [Neorhizobium galegae]|uniref:OmpA family protein n=1 Tax=Neorhizobium galegae TaxID=399 RepID=UPI0006223C69|nr:OmpA family protein [Neorhizobium galegae]KAB1122722.1 OmpA family protein [Neorhizobium galegae]MCQ1807840.1 OmpA family protein [Neorhizobium galegae]CDZ56645.1 OmpA/MotB domain protein [Neorhizobium galegae bv. orientalis]CDZ64276.1 OmpA/MotB domain protein [Neorhizobium galegae bv. orientalis]